MGLYKRGGTWWMSFSHGGRHFRRSTGTTNRKLAEAVLSKVRTGIIEGAWFDVAEERTRTVRELIERFLADYAAKKRSARSYRGYAKPLLAFFGDATLADVTPKIITAYKAKRSAEGVGPASINRELATLKRAFNLAVREWEWCRYNPVLRVSMEKEPPGRTRYLSPGEEAALVTACPEWLRDIVVFAVNTGMRQGEILSLRWPSVDLFRRTATVEQSKNGEKRTIPLNEAALELLKARAKVRSIKSDLAFSSAAETMIDNCNLGRAFRPAANRAGLKDIRFHDLRHTFATRLVQAGVDLYSVQRLLGHKTPAMTGRYAHHSTESLRGAVHMLAHFAQASRIFTNLSQSDSLPAAGIGISD